MQLLLLLAGLGTRLRPLTFTTPKCLIRLAGKPVLGHLLDYLLDQLSITEVIAVCSERDRDPIERYLQGHYSLPFTTVVQPSARGQADAVRVAGGYLRGPLLIAFGDTIVRADLAELCGNPAGVTLLAQTVEDPSAHGSLVLSGDKVIAIEEKRRSLETAPVAVGLYFVREVEFFLKCTDVAVREAGKRGSEAYLAEAFREMIASGSSIGVQMAEAWEDCGETSALLRAHRFLLDESSPQSPVQPPPTVITSPVMIERDAIIRASEIGPYVSIQAGVTVDGSILRDCIIAEGAVIENSVLTNSIIGSHCYIRGLRRGDGLLLGDHSRVISDD